MPRAVVTGVSSGLGRAVAERLVELEWDVIGTVRDQNRASGVGFESVTLDVTDDAAVESFGGFIDRTWTQLDALVNNAGHLILGPVEEVTPAELRHQLDVNVVGAAAMTRTLLPMLRAASGVVVQVSSVAGQIGFPLMGAYDASKFALEGLSEALALEVADQGVRVILVEPSAFRTEIAREGSIASARGASGCYLDGWQEQDEWVTWMRSEEAPDPGPCVAAIVAAVTKSDAPARIAVGERTASDIREHALEVVTQIDRSEEFLRTSGM